MTKKRDTNKTTSGIKRGFKLLNVSVVQGADTKLHSGLHHHLKGV